MIRFRRKARQELWDAVAYYELQRPGLGAEFDQGLATLLDLAVENPSRFQLVDPLVRKIRFKRFHFFIYFTEISPGIIQVVAMVHARRSPEWIQNRLTE
jgi:plasmid stabilization system protein ParE